MDEGSGDQERPGPAFAGHVQPGKALPGLVRRLRRVVVQANVEDGRLGVQEYAIEKLACRRSSSVGPGAKDIGGEV